MKREKLVTGATGFADNDKALGYIPYIKIKASQDSDVENVSGTMYSSYCLKIYILLITEDGLSSSMKLQIYAYYQKKKRFSKYNSPKIIQNLNFFL